MAKKRNRNRKRRRQQQQQQLRQLHTQSLQRSVEADLAYEEYHEKLKDNQKQVQQIKDDILGRTVFVTSVLNLNNPTNLVKLESFMQQTYGLVDKCEVTSYGKRKSSGGRTAPPPARVRFRYTRDADKIFEMHSAVPSLAEARQKKVTAQIPCPSVGYKGILKVGPTNAYKNMVEDEITGSKQIRINTQKLALGHWFPSGHDACLMFPELADEIELPNGYHQFVQEQDTNLSPVLKIDLQRGVIELDFTDCVSQSNPESGDPMGGLLSLIAQMDDVFSPSREVLASFRFKDLEHPLELTKERYSNISLIISLKYPPRLYTIITDPIGRENKTRQVDIAGISNDLIGRCYAYKLSVSEAEIGRLLLNSEALSKLHNFGILPLEQDSLQQASSLQVECVVETQRRLVRENLSRLGNSKVGLLLRSLLDSHTFTWFDLLRDKAETDVGRRGLFELIEHVHCKQSANVLVQMRDITGKTRFPAQIFFFFFGDDTDNKGINGRIVPDYCAEVPRIIVTPSRVSLVGFQVEMSNRIIRKFVQQQGFSDEAFVRVTISEENGDKPFPDDLKAEGSGDGPVAKRLRSLLMEGLIVNGSHYQFLAYSSSQLKELSLWMICPELGWTIDRMRASMGDFSMCKTPPKYAARIGQCFSTTVETIAGGYGQGGRSARLRVDDAYPDITSIFNGDEMVHSDGAGIIRLDVLRDMVQQLPFAPKDTRDVSIIQIRYGGAKGTLTGWDFSALNNSRCRSYDVCLRPSMVKFKAPYDHLEVVALGNRIPYYLNRNVILLAGRAGVPDAIFISMQSEMLNSLNRILKDATFAASYVPRLSGPDSGLMSTLEKMLLAGIQPKDDPFLFSTLHAIRAHHLMNLRKKARIFVRDGAVIMGSIDELGIIPEGCVFVQVRKAEENENGATRGFEPIVGPVMVTKHPAVHPGDLRMLLAVDIPQLREHRNVILFSQHGSRPEADKMSGSDLDGDQFAVTWDKRLFLIERAAPMDYSPAKPRIEQDGISDRSVIDHFITHARSDNVGRIAMLWLDHAVEKKNAGCDECLQLAGLHSVAVDFPKSGIPAVIPKELHISSTQPRAHWRELKNRSTFHCESIVGQLYDKAVKEIASKTYTPSSLAARNRSKQGQLLIFGDPEAILAAKHSCYDPSIPQRLGWVPSQHSNGVLQNYACSQRDQYESRISEIMNRYKIKSEGEIVTGCILKYHRLEKRRRHDVSEEIRREIRLIKAEFRSEFFKAVYHLMHSRVAYLRDDIDASNSNEAVSAVGNGDNGIAQDEEEIDEELLKGIENAATLNSVRSFASNSSGFIDEARDYSKKLAAAYYIASYSPYMHSIDSRFVLYSFPWLTAGDVIGSGLNEWYISRA